MFENKMAVFGADCQVIMSLQIEFDWAVIINRISYGFLLFN